MSKYSVNQYSVNALGKNRKKHLAIAILTKESQAIARNNNEKDNSYKITNDYKITYYTDYRAMKHLQGKTTKKRRRY